MAGRVLKMINRKLNILWRQNKYLSYSSRRLLCNALIQPYFNYGCTTWYPLLRNTLKTNLQIAQNKCIRFSLQLSPRGHIHPSHFRKINWPPAERRVELCTSTTVFKYWKGIAPFHLNDMFMHSLNNYNTRSEMALNITLFRTIEGQKSMSFLRPKFWTKLNSNIKTAATIVSFNNRFKKNSYCKSEQFYCFCYCFQLINYLFICLFIYLFIYLFVYLFVYLFIYLF